MLPVYRIFLSKGEPEFATQDLTDCKQGWTDMTLTGIQYSTYFQYGYKSIHLNSKSDLLLIRAYFRFTHDPQWESYIKNFQSDVQKRRKAKKYHDALRKTENQMAVVPKKLPGDFRKWIQEEVLYKSRYIYYKYERKKKGKAQTGYCTYCRKDVLVDNAKHRTEGICPSCGTSITYLCISKANWIKDEVGANLIQSYKDGFVIRAFKVEKTYQKTYRTPKTSIYEKERVFFRKSGEINRYVYYHCDEINETIWQPVETRYTIQEINGVLYKSNLNQILALTKFCYSGLPEYAFSEQTKQINTGTYLELYRKFPKIEHLSKMGLSHLIDDLVVYGSSAELLKNNHSTIFEVLGLSKEDTRFLQRINGNYKMLKDLWSIRGKQIKLTYEQIEESKLLFGDSFRRFLEGFNYTSASKLLKYIKSQAQGKKKDRYQVALLDWLDYIKDGKELKYDFKNSFVLFPRDLNEAHQTTILLLEKEREKKLNRKHREIKSMYQTLLQTYGFSNKQFLIVPPKDASDIIREGQQLHHCVGRYVDRVAKGETIILFIRTKENPEEAFYTMEVQDGKIIQCRGKFNVGMSDEVKAFTEAFRKKVLERLAEKPKEEKQRLFHKKPA